MSTAVILAKKTEAWTVFQKMIFENFTAREALADVYNDAFFYAKDNLKVVEDYFEEETGYGDLWTQFEYDNKEQALKQARENLKAFPTFAESKEFVETLFFTALVHGGMQNY